MRVKAVNELAKVNTKRAAVRAVEILVDSTIAVAPDEVVASLVSQKSGAAALSAALRFIGLLGRFFFLARGNPRHADSVADHVGWSFLSMRSLGHQPNIGTFL